MAGTCFTETSPLPSTNTNAGFRWLTTELDPLNNLELRMMELESQSAENAGLLGIAGGAHVGLIALVLFITAVLRVEKPNADILSKPSATPTPGTSNTASCAWTHSAEQICSHQCSDQQLPQPGEITTELEVVAGGGSY